MNSALAAKSFIVDNNKLLIIKRADNDVHRPSIWEIPGGRLNQGEDPSKGLIRETKEETNLDIEVKDILNKQSFVRDDGQSINMTIFLCNALTKEVKLSEEHTDFEWININNAKSKISKFFHEEVDIFLSLK